MKVWIPLAASMIVLLPTMLRAAEADEDAKLTAFFRAYLDETFQAEPVLATHLGDHRFDDRLDDLSPEARAANLERRRRTLEQLPKRVDYQKLSRDGQIDYEIFRH